MTDNITLSRRTSSELVRHDGQDTRVVMVKRQIEVPADLIYEIPGGRGGYLASAFDIFAREMGIQFELGETAKTFDGRGNLKTVSVKVKATYFNSRGAIVHDEVESFIDVESLYLESRAKWGRKVFAKSWEEAQAKCANPDFLVADEKHGRNGSYTEYWERAKTIVEYDANSMPIFTYKLPPDAERQVFENYMTLRKNALQKAQTVARRTLTQRAMAVKSFDKEKNPTGTLTIYGAVREVGEVADDLYGDSLPETSDEITSYPITEAKPGGADMPPHDHSREESAPTESPDASPDSQRNPKVEDRSRCSDCGKVLSDKAFAYFQEHPTYTPRCYDCNQKRRATNGNGR